MTHIYQKQNAQVAQEMRRRYSIAEINILRKFEGRSLIEDRIARQMNKLHRLWFGSANKG
jgi:hypothetical protein